MLGNTAPCILELCSAVFPRVKSARLWVWTGRMAVPEWVPGTDGYLHVHPDNSPGPTGRDCRSLRCRNVASNSRSLMEPVGDWRAL